MEDYHVDLQELFQHIWLLNAIFACCYLFCMYLSLCYYFPSLILPGVHVIDVSTIHSGLDSMADRPAKLSDIFLTQRMQVSLWLADLSTCFTMLNKDELKHLLI